MRGLPLLALLLSCGARSELLLDEPPPAVPEVCNGLDDDGDGLVDEDLGELTCGLGACLRTAPACVGGAPGECLPGVPSDEVCNGLDDDCDGGTDEALGLVRVGGPYLVTGELHYLAWSELVPTSDGFFLVYATSFDGTSPTPNVFLARLTADGQSIGPPTILTDRNVPNGPRLSPASDGGWLVSYCGRFGFEDRAASGHLSADGAFVEHGERSPKGKNCGAGEPDAIWSGQRMLFGWADNGSPDSVYLDRADASGASLGASAIDTGSDLFALPRFAALGNRTLVAYSRQDEPGVSLLRVRLLDALGEDAAEPLLVGAPLPLGTWSEISVAAQPGSGFLLLGPNRFAPGMFRMRFDEAGALLAGPEVWPAVPQFVTTGSLLAARPGGGYVAMGNASDAAASYDFVHVLDATGEVTDTWSTLEDPVEPVVGFPAVAFRDGKIFVAYSSYDVPDTEFPELRVLVLGCGAP